MKKSKPITQKKQKVSSRQRINLFSSDSFWKIAFLSSLALSLISIYVTYQFRPFTLFDNFLFDRNDSWCNANTEGVIGHCFGDFHQGVSPDPKMDPFPMTADVIVLSIADGYIWKLGNLVYSLLGPKITLFAFLIIYQMAVITGWYKLKSMYRTNWWFFIFGITSLPSVLAVMRMNSICLAFLAFVFYLEAVQLKKRKMQICLIVICCVFKPQFGALILINLINREYKFAIVKMAAVISTMFAAILLLYNFRVAVIFDYIETIQGFTKSENPINSFYPVNDSIAHTIAVLYPYLGYSVARFDMQKLISILVILILISLFIYQPSKNRMDNMYQVVFLVMFGLSEIVAPYYLLILSPIVIHMLQEGKDSPLKKLLAINLVFANSYIIIPAWDNSGIIFQSRQMTSYFQITIQNLLTNFTILVFTLIAIRIHLQNLNQRFFKHEQ